MNKLRTKIRTKLLLLIIITGLASALLFQGMWNCRWKVWDVLSDAGFFDDILPSADDNFWNNLFNRAADYDLPASETDSKAIDALTPFFDETADEYTSIYLYSLTEGEYLVGRYAQIMDSEIFVYHLTLPTDGQTEPMKNASKCRLSLRMDMLLSSSISIIRRISLHHISSPALSAA
ncbi:hypothetical protein [Dorea sp. AM58-8]|uniref:hypothetical protein n=1 Tax=Dorea sp. AM58-8 TaxID=2292346 RepID=UPI000E535BA1|nr:hypothetical protein [Dorea sp. AM58-8]RGY79870.1 hypothetical protein DXA18_11200 [Dorea sp. AM58-8]